MLANSALHPRPRRAAHRAEGAQGPRQRGQVDSPQFRQTFAAVWRNSDETCAISDRDINMFMRASTSAIALAAALAFSGQSVNASYGHDPHFRSNYHSW